MTNPTHFHDFKPCEAVRLTAESDNARINGLAALIAATIAERTTDDST